MKNWKLACARVAISTLGSVAQAKTPVMICTTDIPQYSEIMDNKLGATIMRGSVYIDIDAKKTVWYGTGGYSQLTAERRDGRVVITRLTGSGGGVEPINSVEKMGSTRILNVTESFGSPAKIILTLNGSTGSALYVDGSSRQELKFCTTDVAGN